MPLSSISPEPAESILNTGGLCLVMVVRNDAQVITRCLDSVRPIISTWVICDAGSTDGTQDKIRDSLDGIPGELHVVPRVNLGHNRAEALRLASGKASYHLLLDSDMAVNVCSPLEHALSADSYLLRQQGDLECWLECLLSDRHQWRCAGSARPFFHSRTASTRHKLGNFSIVRHRDAPRTPPEIHCEVEALKSELHRGANVARCTFYLAECYRELGNLPLAIEYYETRSKMAGWEEEIWYSIYQVARLQQRLGIAWVLVLDQYLRAYQFRPTRAEPLFHVARFYRQNAQYALAHMFSTAGLRIPLPDDLLFIDRSVYEYGMEFEHCLSCQQLGKQKEAAHSAEQILSCPGIPEDVRVAAQQCLDPPLRTQALLNHPPNGASRESSRTHPNGFPVERRAACPPIPQTRQPS